LNGAIIDAIPKPSVRLAKLHPSIPPTDMSGCPRIILISSEAQSGAAVPSDTRNTLKTGESILKFFEIESEESHSNLAPHTSNANPTGKSKNDQKINTIRHS
jgi:hypothetical protein